MDLRLRNTLPQCKKQWEREWDKWRTEMRILNWGYRKKIRSQNHWIEEITKGIIEGNGSELEITCTTDPKDTLYSRKNKRSDIHTTHFVINKILLQWKKKSPIRKAWNKLPTKETKPGWLPFSLLLLQMLEDILQSFKGKGSDLRIV